MLLKSVLNVPGDYQKTLTLRLWTSLGLLAMGVTGLVCYRLLVPGSGLPDFARGFYLGAAYGILLGAVILLVRVIYLLRHPQARRQAQVKEQDEREQAILHNSFQTAGFVTFFVSAAALFVVLPLSQPAFAALLSAMVLYALAFLAATLYYQRRM